MQERTIFFLSLYKMQQMQRTYTKHYSFFVAFYTLLYQITNYNVQITNQMGNGKGQMGNSGAAARAECQGDGVSDTRCQLLRPPDREGNVKSGVFNTVLTFRFLSD